MWSELFRAGVLLAVALLFGMTAWWLVQAVLFGTDQWVRLGLAVVACAGVSGAFAWLSRAEPAPTVVAPPAPLPPLAQSPDDTGDDTRLD